MNNVNKRNVDNSLKRLWSSFSWEYQIHKTSSETPLCVFQDILCSTILKMLSFRQQNFLVTFDNLKVAQEKQTCKLEPGDILLFSPETKSIPKWKSVLHLICSSTAKFYFNFLLTDSLSTRELLMTCLDNMKQWGSATVLLHLCSDLVSQHLGKNRGGKCLGLRRNPNTFNRVLYALLNLPSC